MKPVQLDLPRRMEKRYVILADRGFLDRNLLVERRQFSDKERVQTIYFNNDEQSLGFDHTLKARRYLLVPSDPTFLDLSATFFLDIKTGPSDFKQKQRFDEVPLAESMAFLNAHREVEDKVRPYVLVEYSRKHYAPIGIDGIRLTVDSDLTYVFFPPGTETGAILNQEKEFVRLEVKMKDPNPEKIELMARIFQELGLIPIISKKAVALNWLDGYLIQHFGMPFSKELSGVEIEAKLEVEDELLIHKVKQMFRSKDVDGFTVLPHFPYTRQSSSINRYCISSTGNKFKATLRQDTATIVIKEDSQRILDASGLNYILKRNEKKGERLRVDAEELLQATVLGEMHRMKKTFYLRNIRTGRFYQVCLDRSQGPKGVLHQMEVEYTGTHGKPETDDLKAEKEMIQDITRITSILLQSFPELKPTQLTKRDWLLGV